MRAGNRSQAAVRHGFPLYLTDEHAAGDSALFAACEDEGRDTNGMRYMISGFESPE